MITKSLAQQISPGNKKRSGAIDWQSHLPSLTKFRQGHLPKRKHAQIKTYATFKCSHIPQHNTTCRQRFRERLHPYASRKYRPRSQMRWIRQQKTSHHPPTAAAHAPASHKERTRTGAQKARPKTRHGPTNQPTGMTDRMPWRIILPFATNTPTDRNTRKTHHEPRSQSTQPRESEQTRQYIPQKTPRDAETSSRSRPPTATAGSAKRTGTSPPLTTYAGRKQNAKRPASHNNDHTRRFPSTMTQNRSHPKQRTHITSPARQLHARGSIV